MAREIPQLVRAAAGLAATVLDEARKLPETLPGLPVRIVGLAMQTAMKLQQGYSGLVARGDEVFTGIRGEDEPGLATFDEDVEAQTGGYRESAFDRADVTFADNEVAGLPDDVADAAVAAVEELADEISAAEAALETAAVEAPSTDEVLDELAIDEHLEAAPAERAPGTPAAKKAAPAKKQAAKKAPARKAPAKERAASVVTEGEAAVDDALGSQPAPAPSAAPAAEPPAAEAPAAEAPAAETPAPAEVPAAETPPPAEAPAAETPPPAEAPAAETPPPAETSAPAETPAAAGLPDPTTGARTAPVEGYDDWSIAQLRGRLRGYAEQTVQELLDYEQSALAREPYLRMLRNRLERLRAESA
jgi:hypothetical protein